MARTSRIPARIPPPGKPDPAPPVARGLRGDAGLWVIDHGAPIEEWRWLRRLLAKRAGR